MPKYHRFDIINGSIKLLDGKPGQNTKYSLIKDAIDVSGKSVLDIGASNGLYSCLAALKGASSIVALDKNDGLIGGCPVSQIDGLAKEHKLNINTVDGCISQYNKPANVVFAFAIMHHLYYNIYGTGCMDAMIRKLASLTNEVLFIEWVDVNKYGPYKNRTPYSHQDFIHQVDLQFSRHNLIGTTVEYQSDRKPRLLYACYK